MAYCKKCPYTSKIKRKFGVTTRCNLEPTNMNVTYYCRNDKHDNEENLLCPFLNFQTRIRGIDYTKYITDDMPEQYGTDFMEDNYDYNR